MADGAAVRLDCGGAPLTCSSDEALESFNKGLLEYVSVRQSALSHWERAVELDPAFVLAHCALGASWLADLKAPNNPKVAVHVEAVKQCPQEGMTEREKGHIKALLANASGNLPKATEELVAVLIEHPFDALAVRMLVGAYIQLGEFVRMRDMLAHVLPHWTEDMLLYPFILAFYAFSLEQNNQRDKGEEIARKALSLQKCAPFATHALAHVIEEERDAGAGVEFLTETRDDWKTSVFGGHLVWHLTLYYVDLGDTDAILHEFDTVLYDRATPDNLFGLIDASSLLWRLNLMGIDPGEKRWGRVTDSFIKFIGNHRLAWYDTHLMMALSHGKVHESAARLALAELMIKSMEAYAKTDVSTNCAIAEKLGVPVCNALLAYGKEQYEEVLQLLLPLRYDLVRLGGSWSQRQVLTLTMIQAAIRSNNLPLSLSLVSELKAQKPRSQLLARLFEQLMSSYKRETQAPPLLEPAAKRPHLDHP